MEKYPVKIISGKYKGLIGWTYHKEANQWGNIMFYSDQGSCPYRVCLRFSDVEYI